MKIIRLYLTIMQPILRKINPKKEFKLNYLLLEALVLGLPIAIVYTGIFYLFYILIQ